MSGDLQITGIMGVTVLCYAVPRVFMLVRLVCGHWNQGSISFWLVASISMQNKQKKCQCDKSEKPVFHKAFEKKHFYYAENFNWSFICPTLP